MDKIKMYKMIADGTSVSVYDVLEWSKWFEIADRRIAHTQVSDDVEVSTVFLGLDHSFGGSGSPVLFETMVVGGDLDGEQERYTTIEDAQQGHDRMVASVLRK